VLQARERRRKQCLEETVVRERPLAPKLVHAIGVRQQATDPQRVGGRPLAPLDHGCELTGLAFEVRATDHCR